MTKATLALLVLAVAPMLVDGWLSRRGPKSLRGLAWVPFGKAHVVTLHDSHLAAAATRSARPTHKPSTSAIPENGIVPFPAEETGDDVRLVPIEGSTTAKLMPSATWLNVQPSAFLDARIGADCDLVVLRAHITPLAFLPAVAIVAAYVVDRQTELLIAAFVVLIASVRSLIATSQAITWAFHVTEARLSAPIGGWAKAEAAARGERATAATDRAQPEEKREQAEKPSTAATAEASTRVLLDEEDGKETVVVMAPVEREPAVPRMRMKKSSAGSRAT